MSERFNKYKSLDERMLVMKGFFSEYYRQTFTNNGMEDKVDFTTLELKGIAAFIDQTQEYTMSELAHNAHLPLSNISSIINRLARKGIVKRRRDPKDRRVVRACLTDRGKTMLYDFMRKRGLELENCLGRLSAQDRHDLFLALEKATEILKKIRYTDTGTAQGEPGCKLKQPV